MHKSKLQELCHRRRWSLPKYSAIHVDGPPHNPSFKGTVFVNGLTFTSSETFNSSGEAQNQAAMKAFLNFTSLLSSSSKPTNEFGSKEEVKACKPQESPVPQQSPVIISDMDHQNCARKNNLDPPVFTVKREGPPHNIHYKATVVIDGKSFESPTSFNTIKEAEQAAAKFVDTFQKDESCPSKNLLQELSEREGFSKPIYKTTQIGPPHMPTFFSTVEVEGIGFHGKASKSEKEAEEDAAKIAYITLKECGRHTYADLSSSIGEKQAVKSTHESHIVKSKQKLKPVPEDELLDDQILPTDFQVNNGIQNESLPLPPNKKMKISNMHSSSSPKSSPFSHAELPCVRISEFNKAKTPNTSSYMLGNKLKVYTSFPDIVFPEGITVVPIGEDKWIAASLEFPK